MYSLDFIRIFWQEVVKTKAARLQPLNASSNVNLDGFIAAAKRLNCHFRNGHCSKGQEWHEKGSLLVCDSLIYFEKLSPALSGLDRLQLVHVTQLVICLVQLLHRISIYHVYFMVEDSFLVHWVLPCCSLHPFILSHYGPSLFVQRVPILISILLSSLNLHLKIYCRLNSSFCVKLLMPQ